MTKDHLAQRTTEGIEDTELKKENTKYKTQTIISLGIYVLVFPLYSAQRLCVLCGRSL